MFTSGPRSGVDFTSGKWLLNELDSPKNQRDKLTAESLEFFKKKLGERVSYIHDVNGLLVPRKISFNPNKTKLKELKEGTGFDFFINISTKKIKVISLRLNFINLITKQEETKLLYLSKFMI